MMTKTAAKVNRYQTAIDAFQKLTGSLKDQLSGYKNTYSLRKLQPKDNWAARDLIHKSLLKRGGVGMDLFYYDKELSDLYTHYNWSDAFFAVLTFKKEIIGTVGIKPVEEQPSQFSTLACEIKKLHLSDQYPEGHRERLLDFAIKRGIEIGYSQFQVLVGIHDFAFERLLQSRGFQTHSNASLPGMKMMKYTLPDLLSKAS